MPAINSFQPMQGWALFPKRLRHADTVQQVPATRDDGKVPAIGSLRSDWVAIINHDTIELSLSQSQRQCGPSGTSTNNCDIENRLPHG